MNKKPFTFDRVVRMLIGLTTLVLLFLLVKRLSDVLLPFLVAWLIAYLLQPTVHFFQYKLKLKSRIVSIICTLLLTFGILTAILLVLIPLISNEIQKFSHLISEYSQNFNVDSFLPVAWQNEVRNYLSKMNLHSVLQDDNIMTGLKQLAPKLWSLISSSLNLILGIAVLMVGFLYLIFILLDYEKITDGWIGLIPVKYRDLVTEIFEDMENGMNRYFRGQAIVASIVGILFVVGFSIIQLPMGIILGLLIGLLTMVPYLKAVAIIPCLAMGFLQSMETGQGFGSVILGIAIVFILIQVIEDMLIVPNVMGRVTGLNPAIILLSLSVWGSLMGMVGLIIALPMTTLIISYYKRFVLKEKRDESLPPDEEAQIDQTSKTVDI